MPLDASIILGGQSPSQGNTLQPLQTIATVENIAAQRAERQAQTENTLALAQQRIEAMKRIAAINAAVQAANGDRDMAADALDKTGQSGAASDLRKQTEADRQAAEKAVSDHIASVSATLDLGGRLLNVLRESPTLPTYTATRSALLGLARDPQTQQFLSSVLPENPNEGDIPSIVDAVQQAAVPAKERLAQLEAAADKWRTGDQRGAIASSLAAAKTPQERLAVLATYGKMAPADVLAPFQMLVSNGASADEILKAGMTPSEQAKVANDLRPVYESKSVLLDGKPAEVRFDSKSGRFLDANNVDVSARVRPIPPQSAQTAVVLGGQSDTVQGYIQDLLTGSKKITDVPASGRMRDQVVGELHKEGFDISKPLTAQSQARVEFAKAVIPQVQQVVDLAHQIDTAGLMGTVGGRFRQLASKESSASSLEGLSDAQKRLVGQFVTKAGLLMSGVAMVHGGAKGGGSTQMLEQLKPLLDPGNKDLPTYLGNLDGALSVLGGYAAMGGAGASSTSDKTVTQAQLQAIAKKRGTTVDQERKRAEDAGYVVR